MKVKSRSQEKLLDLGWVLQELGHTPESFARVIGRNASALRRSIKGMTTMHHSAARDVAEGLAREGWRGDPNRIRQLREAAHGKLGRQGRVLPSGHIIMADGSVVDPASQPSVRGGSEPPAAVRVRSALAELMRAVGREGVDWVYERVFGVKPGTPYEKQ